MIQYANNYSSKYVWKIIENVGWFYATFVAFTELMLLRLFKFVFAIKWSLLCICAS